MNNSVDERIVVLSFDNEAFEKKTAESLDTLQKLDKSLELSDGTKGLNRIADAVGKVNLSGISDSVDTVTAKFSMLSVIGTTALAKLTTSAMDTFTKIVTYVPNKISQGGLTRALNIEQARFQIKGLGKDWDKLSEDINYGVADTAYGFDEAARAASQLSASGVRAGKEMKAALRGISGVAAMTNSSYTEMADIFVTVAANGKLMATDLNRIGARGLNSRAPLAQYMTKVKEGSVDASKTVQKEVGEAMAYLQQKGQWTGKFLEKDIRELTKAGLLGFNVFKNAMDDAFGENATKANETYTGALANLNAALSRIGADYQATRIENLRDIFNALRGTIDATRANIFPFVNMWNNFTKAVTAKAVVPAINAITKALSSTTLYKYGKYLLNPDDKEIKKAWKDVEKQGLNVVNVLKLLKNILGFIGSIGVSAFNVIAGAAKGVWDIVNSILKIFLAPFGKIVDLTKMLGKGSENLKRVSADFGNTIEKRLGKVADVIDNAAASLADFFKKNEYLPKIKNAALQLFDALKRGFEWLGQKFNELKESEFGQKIIEYGTQAKELLEDLAKGALDTIIKGVDHLANIKDFNFITELQNFYHGVGSRLSDLFKSIEGLGNPFAKLFSTGTPEVEKLKKGMDSVSSLEDPFGKFSSFLSKIKDEIKGFAGIDKTAEKGIDTFEKITGKLSKAFENFDLDEFLDSGMQAAKIAAIISLISPARSLFFALAKGIQGVTNPLVSITANIQLMTKFAARFLLVPLAVLSIAAALKMLAKIKAKDLAKSVAALTIALAAVTGLFIAIEKFMSKGAVDSVALARASISIMQISAAMLILGFAVEKIASIPVKALLKGAVAITGFVAIFAGMSHFIKNVHLSSKMFTSMAFSILLLVPAMILLSKLKARTILRGGAIISAFVLMFAASSRVMAANTIGASAFIGLAGAIALLVPSLMLLSMIPAAKLIKAIGAIEIILASLILTVNLCQTNLVGVKAFNALSVALLAVTGAIMMLAIIPVDRLLASALGLAAVMTAMGYAGRVAEHTSPKIIILIGALYLLGGLFAAMSLLDPDKLLKNAVGLTAGVAAVAELAGVIVLLSHFKVPMAGAIEALKIIGLAALALLTAATVLGGIAQIPGAKKVLSDGVEIAKIIGLMIGEFVGSIIGGVGAGITATLPIMADYLSDFMLRIQPFIELASGIKKSSTIGIKNLAEAFLALTAAGTVDSISRFLNLGRSGLDKFATDMLLFLPRFKKFVDGVNELSEDDLDKVKLVGKAMKAMADAANQIPNSGGWVGKIVGENDIDAFGEQLESFIDCFKNASESAALVTDAGITNISKIASAAKAMAEMAQEVPNTGGKLAIFTGDNYLFKSFANGTEKGFGVQLKGFVTCFKDAAEESKGLTKAGRKRLINIADAAKSFAEFAQKVPNSGTSVKSLLLGNNTLFSSFNGKSGLGATGFGPQIRGFVTCFSEAAEAAETIKGYRGDEGFTKLNRIADAAKAFAEMTNMLPETGGFKQGFLGQQDFKKFSKDLVKFIESLEPIREYLQGKNALSSGQISNLKFIGEAAKAFAETAAALPREKVYVAEGFDVNFESFGQKIASLVKAVSEILPDMANISEGDIEKLKGISQIAKNLGSIYTAMHEAGILAASDDSTLSDAAGSMLKISIVSSGVTSLMNAMVPLLNKLPDEVPQGKLDAMSASVEALKDVAATLVDISKNNINESRINLFIGYLATNENNLGDAILQFYNKFADLKNTKRLRNISEVAQAIGDFLANIGNATQLSSNITTVVEQLPELGAHIKEFVDSINGLSDDDMSGVTDKLTKIEDVLKKIGELKPSDFDVKSVGVGIIDEIVKGIGNNEYRISKEAGNAISSAAKSTNTKAYTDVGKKMAERLAKALGSDTAIASVKNASSNLSSKGASAASGYIQYALWYEAGSHNAEGFVSGIKSKLKSAYDAGVSISESAQKGSKDTDERESPSKVYRQFGIYNVEGFINGLLYMEDKLYRTSSTLATGAQNSFSEAFDDFSSPVITPVLDLTELSSQAGDIGTILNNQNGVNLSSSIGGAMATAVDPNAQLYASMTELSNKISEMEKVMVKTRVDPNQIYTAVKTGASDSTLSVTLNHRELNRQVSRMGGSK